MVEVESKMDESLHHVKSRATLLSRCSYTYIVHLSLKELGIEPGSEASHLMKKTIQILYENPGMVLTKGVYYSVGMFSNPRMGERTVESAIRRGIRQAWETRDERIWECYFPVGTAGRTECPSNKEFLSAVIDFVISWEGFCEEVNYEKEHK